MVFLVNRWTVRIKSGRDQIYVAIISQSPMLADQFTTYVMRLCTFLDQEGHEGASVGRNRFMFVHEEIEHPYQGWFVLVS